MLWLIDKAEANGQAGQILVGPLFLKVKKLHFTKASNKSTRVIFGLVQLVVL